MSHKFDAAIPQSVIKTKPDQSKANYVDGHYVISQLNELVGHGNWSYECTNYTVVEEEQRNNSNAKLAWYVSYICQCRLTAIIDGNTVVRHDIGFGSGDGMASAGKAHESAVKECATDALKRSARTLGQALGLALYDKTGEHIEQDSPNKPASTSEVSPAKHKARDVVSRLGLSNQEVKDYNDRIKPYFADPAEFWASRGGDFQKPEDVSAAILEMEKVKA